ncbi:MAG TPA: ester cyclase [Terracidiphilus sp.]|nr:ester cyclase [Terracidiphilus sp.]
MPSQPHANELLLRRLFEEVWNQKNGAAIEEIFATGCVIYGLPDPDAVLRGPEQFRAVFQAFIHAFPDVHITIQDVIAAGDRVAVRWSAIGTHLGPELGFAPTGKRVPLDGATIGVVRDGRISEAWNMMDMGHLFEALRGDSSRF